MIKKRSELQAMSNEELESYEQSLLALWTPRIALENQIDRLSTEYKGQLEIFNKLKKPRCSRKLTPKKFGLLIERKNLNFREKA